MEAKLLRLWVGTLKVYRSNVEVEPEGRHFDGLIGWLENYIEASEQRLLTPAAPDPAILAQFSDEQIYSEAVRRRYRFTEPQGG